MKTLIGKNNYLFLQNDSNKELEVHNNNLCLISTDSFFKYEKYIHQYLLIVFPNKSLVHKDYLPDHYDLKYRPGFDYYKKYFKNHIIDLYPYLSKEDTFYKTDTHMNINGAYISYQIVIDKINELFGLQIEKINIAINKVECVLNDLNLGIGDLTWEMNLGDQKLDDRLDTYYFSEEMEIIYNKYKIGSDFRGLSILNYELEDNTSLHTDEIIDWNIVSNYIIHTTNNRAAKRRKIIIFYDSFLLSSLGLWIQQFYDVYFIKNTFDPILVEKIKPDYIFEFRVERFLN